MNAPPRKPRAPAFAIASAVVLPFAIAALGLDLLRSRVHAPLSFSAIQSGEIVRNLTLAGKMMAIFAVATLLHKAPDFVYKAF